MDRQAASSNRYNRGDSNKPSANIIIRTIIEFASCITYIAIGASYKDECPTQDHIPIYLIGKVSSLHLFIISNLKYFINLISVTGVTLLVVAFARLALPYVGDTAKRYINIFIGLISLFYFCWFIYGSVIVFKIWKPYYNHFWTEYYCNKTVYLFAFSTIIITYILLAVGLLYTLFRKLRPKRQSNESYA